MKPRVFIGSSVESIDVAYAAQEALEYSCEATVWDQGVFKLSKHTMASLMDVLDESDFGIFVFTPDDVATLRKAEVQVVRDNVVFELGLFVGRLGPERSFLLMPRGQEDFHLPTDLLGITPATYEPDRQDENLVAALGPAINRIRKSMAKLKRLKDEQADIQAEEQEAEVEAAEDLISDPNDCISLIQSWMGRRPASENVKAIFYKEVDRELRLEPGSTERHIGEAAAKFRYQVARKGKDTIIFEKMPVAIRSMRGNYF